MKIYAENSKVTFECDYCGCKTPIPAAKSTRAFMHNFNAFKREHEWGCKIKKQRHDAVDLSKKTTTEILEKLQAGDSWG